MNGNRKPGDISAKKPVDVLRQYRDRLHQSTRRGGLLNAFPTRSFKRVDLTQFNLPDPELAGTLVEKLLRSERGKLSFDLDSSSETDGSRSPEAALYSLCSCGLARTAEAYRRETGVRSLWLAYPLFHARAQDSTGKWQTVLAPIFLWPIRVQTPLEAQGQVVISRDEEAGGAKYNKALDLWITDNLGFNPEDPHLDVFEETTLEQLQAVVAKLYAGLRQPPSVSLAGPIMPVPAREDLEQREHPGVLHAGIIGLIQWEKQALTFDFEKLIETGESTELVDDYLSGRARATPPQLALPVEGDRFHVTEVDPAQERAVFQSRSAPGLLVHGPPGTGKSQTIVNIVADSLAHGQRVLVVCQKRAAIDVVAARLRAQGLGDLFCVVHDSESDRTRTILSTKEQIQALRAPEAASEVVQRREQLAVRITELEGRLDHHTQAMCSPASYGLAYRDLLALTSRLCDESPGIAPNTRLQPLFAEKNRADLDTLNNEVSAVGQLWQKTGPKRNPWRYRLKDLLVDPVLRNQVQQAIAILQKADTAHAALVRANGAGLEFSLAPSEFLKRVPLWRNQVANARPAEIAGAVAHWNQRQWAANWQEFATAVNQRPEPDASRFDPALDRQVCPLSMDKAVARLAQASELIGLEQKWWRWFAPRYYRFHRELREFLRRPQNLAAADLAALEQFLVGWLHRQLRAVRLAEFLAVQSREEPALAPLAAWFAEANETAIKDWLKYLELTEKRAPLTADVWDAIDGFSTWLKPEYLADLRRRTQSGQSLAQAIAQITEGFGVLDSLQILDRSRAQRQGLARGVLEILEDEEPVETPPGDLPARWWGAVRMSAYYCWIEATRAQWPILQELSTEQHAETRRALADALAAKQQLEVVFITELWRARQLERRKGDFNGVLVSRGPNSKRLRQVVELGEPAGLFDFRPCWLTNPNTASQIFPLRRGFFDIVIFDEASQCPIEHALPVIFRAGRIVVAGDEKQLPPTAFFQSGFTFGAEAPETEAEALELAETDLDLQARIEAANRDQALAVSDLLEASKPILGESLLNIHYRSAYPELIQFSNHAFYGANLQVPPSVLSRRNGLAPLVLVESGGVYEKNRNRVEARRIIELLREFWLNGKAPPTAGVVTFNEQQRDLIEDLLQDEAAADAPFRDAYQQQCARMDGEQDAGFFVKNLESVQGDERDVMIFSTTFGSDPAGNFRRFFGPINLAGGERRLNVAITRAKLCNYLVTSMPLALISDRMAGGSFTAGATATGRDYLHAYMQYAQAVSVGEKERQRQTLESVAKLGPAAGASTRRSGESLFENEVRGTLEKLGYQVAAQVGDGGFQFDLAVLHPDPEKGFVLGIECDGKMYHPDWTARSRDLWRQRILEKRGWRIHRVWSVNWWMNREAEIRALAARVESALNDR